MREEYLSLWKYIIENNEKIYYTKTHLPFNFLVNNDKFSIYRKEEEIFTIYKNSVIFAYEEYIYNRVERPSQFSPHIMAPSYLWAIFNQYNPMNEKKENIVATIFLSKRGIACLEKLKKNYNNNISNVFNKIFINDELINKYVESVYDHKEDTNIKKTIRIEKEIRNNINQYSKTYSIPRNLLIDHIIICVYNQNNEINKIEREVYNQIVKYLSKNVNSLTNMNEHITSKVTAFDFGDGNYLKKVLTKIDKITRELVSIKLDAGDKSNNLSKGNGSKNILSSDKPIPDLLLKKIKTLFDEQNKKLPYKFRGILIDEDLIVCTLEVLNDTTNKELPLNHRNATRINTPDGLDKRIKIRRNSDLRTANIVADELSEIGVLEMFRTRILKLRLVLDYSLCV